MAHMRTQIRNALKGIFLNIDEVGDHVFFDRLPALTDEAIPAILIYTGDEAITPKSIGRPSMQERTLQVRLAIAVMDSSFDDSSNYQDKIDDILLEIEKRLSQNITLNDLVTSIRIANTTVDEDNEMESEYGLLFVYCECKYRVSEDAPDISQS